MNQQRPLNAAAKNTNFVPKDALDAKHRELLSAPHWEPQNHPRMSRAARAAQFSPFAALNGFYDEISATSVVVSAERDSQIVQEAEIWPGDDAEPGEPQPEAPTGDSDDFSG